MASQLYFLISPEFIFYKHHTLLVCLHALVSIVAIISSSFAIFQLYSPNVDWSSNEFLKHHIKYVTWLLSVWALVFQLFYFNLYFVIDIIDFYAKRNANLGKLSNALHHVGSYVLFAIVFPISLLVSILFWTIYFWKRDIIYPEVINILFPPVLNHLAHTFPAIFSIIYMFLSNRNEPPIIQSLAGLLAFLLMYIAGQINIKQRDGKWPYLAMEALTPLQMKCMFAISVIGSVCFLLLGYKINDKIKVYRKNILDFTKKYYCHE